MVTLKALRTRLLEVAALAREQHINKDLAAYTVSRGEVEAIIKQLRELYKRDAAPFDEKFLGDVRSAKLCARIIVRPDLDREAVRQHGPLLHGARGFPAKSRPHQ